MTIVDKIIDSIKATHGNDFPVYYHDEPTLNEMTSRMQFPCALVRLLSQGRIVSEAGQRKERVSAAVFFVEPTVFDFDAVRNEAIIDRCKARALAWQNALSQSSTLLLYGDDPRMARLYDPYDDHVTGFGILADLQELEGWTDCPVLHGDFNNDFNNDFNI